MDTREALDEPSNSADLSARTVPPILGVSPCFSSLVCRYPGTAIAPKPQLANKSVAGWVKMAGAMSAASFRASRHVGRAGVISLVSSRDNIRMQGYVIRD